MKVRSATLWDVDAIVKLGKSVNEFQVSDQTVTFWPKNVLRAAIKSKNPVLIAEEEGREIGFIIANYNPSLKKAIIENIYVNPKYRRQDIGKQLLDHLLIALKKLKCEYVCSLADYTNKAAVEFYVKNGFTKGMHCVWLDTVLGKSFKK